MKLKILIFCLVLVCNASQAFAQNVALLVWDKKADQKNELPYNFRDLSPLGINAIGSAQFSETQLKEVRKKYPNEKIVIVDLRRESHGFINGSAVSWRSPFDRSNINKNSSEILRDEKIRLNSVKKDREIIVNKILEKDKKNGWYEEVEPEIIAVEKISTEENLAKENGFEYKRFFVRDHGNPDAKQLLEIVNFIKNFPQDKKIYVHCAAGRGRTTTFLTIYDIIKNGSELSLKEILKRQEKIGGIRLDDVDADAEWRKKLAEERLKMVREFYAVEADARAGLRADTRVRHYN